MVRIKALYDTKRQQSEYIPNAISSLLRFMDQMSPALGNRFSSDTLGINARNVLQQNPLPQKYNFLVTTYGTGGN